MKNKLVVALIIANILVVCALVSRASTFSQEGAAQAADTQSNTSASTMKRGKKNKAEQAATDLGKGTKTSGKDAAKSGKKSGKAVAKVPEDTVKGTENAAKDSTNAVAKTATKTGKGAAKVGRKIGGVFGESKPKNQ